MSDAYRSPCLLVHGLTASPTQLDPVRKVLEVVGCPVEAPLLSGHGTKVEDLIGLQWEDWYHDVLVTAEQLRTVYPLRDRQLFYVGMSFGALLGLKLAIDHPDWLKGLVCIGPPLTMFPWMNIIHPLLTYTPLRWIIRAWPKDYDKAVADPEGREVYRRSSYAQFPLSAVREVRRLQSAVRRDLHKVTTPLLLIHARQDLTAPPEAVSMIARGVRSSVVEQMWCERSSHVATLDYERDAIAARIVEFLHHQAP
ncbi:MAG: alpha/beta fold hydrolase [Deltaproteobacteria bacterium]|nr:alpha/beta fold hydrolase [Deltaproteobacteria bacterium]